MQHPGENGQWPHLDQLYASSAIDFVAFDNYLPLSDWTTGAGGLDAANWQARGADVLADRDAGRARVRPDRRADALLASTI